MKFRLFYCIILLFPAFFGKAETMRFTEIGIHSYILSLDRQIKELNSILAQENFPTLIDVAIHFGTFTLNSTDQKQSADIKLGGSNQVFRDEDKKTRLQNFTLISQYRYNIPLRNRSWVFYPGFATGITFGRLSLIQINQNQFGSSVGNIDIPDYFEKRYPFSTAFIHPKAGINYLFRVNRLNFSVGMEMGYQLAFNGRFRSANRSFLYENSPRFNLSGFTFGINLRVRLPSRGVSTNSTQID